MLQLARQLLPQSSTWQPAALTDTCAVRPPRQLPHELQATCDAAERIVLASFGTSATPEPELLRAVHMAVSGLQNVTVILKVLHRVHGRLSMLTWIK